MCKCECNTNYGGYQLHFSRFVTRPGHYSVFNKITSKQTNKQTNKQTKQKKTRARTCKMLSHEPWYVQWEGCVCVGVFFLWVGGGGWGGSMYLEVLLMNGIDDVWWWCLYMVSITPCKCTQVTLESGTESSWYNCMVSCCLWRINIHYSWKGETFIFRTLNTTSIWSLRTMDEPQLWQVLVARYLI